MQRNEFIPLNLIAADLQDLETLSACLQDSLVKQADMAYLPDQRRFAFMANRFAWEVAGDVPPFLRIRTGVHFDDVKSVRTRYIDRANKQALISILSIRAENKQQDVCLTIHCAGGGEISLIAEAVHVHLSDVRPAWRTRHRPNHDENGQENS